MFSLLDMSMGSLCLDLMISVTTLANARHYSNNEDFSLRRPKISDKTV